MDRRRQASGDAEDQMELLESGDNRTASPDRHMIARRRRESRPRKVGPSIPIKEDSFFGQFFVLELVRRDLDYTFC